MGLEWVDEPNKVKTDSKLNKTMRRHILHEFGHMLGAEHEQFSPYFPWQFKSTVVYEHFEAEINKENRKRGTRWTPKQITNKANERTYRDMLKRLNEADIRYSLFDPKSIMLYYIDLDWIKHKASDKILEELRDDHGGTLKGFGNCHDLSYLDTAIVNEAYADYNPYSRSGSSSSSEEGY